MIIFYFTPDYVNIFVYMYASKMASWFEDWLNLILSQVCNHLYSSTLAPVGELSLNFYGNGKCQSDKCWLTIESFKARESEQQTDKATPKRHPRPLLTAPRPSTAHLINEQPSKRCRKNSKKYLQDTIIRRKEK